MTKKGKINVKAGETGLRQGTPSKYGQTNPSLYGRDAEYAAQQALKTGREIAAINKGVGDFLSAQIEKTGHALAMGEKERRANLDLQAAAELETAQTKSRAEFDMAEQQLIGFEAKGEDKRLKESHEAFTSEFNDEELTMTFGDKVVTFGTQKSYMKAKEGAEAQYHSDRANYAKRRQSEFRRAMEPAFRAFSTAFIARVEQFPDTVEAEVTRYKKEIQDQEWHKELLPGRVDSLVNEKVVGMYTAAASTKMYDGFALATVAAREGGDYETHLDEAEKQIKSFYGKADKNTLSRMQEAIERRRTTLGKIAKGEGEDGMRKTHAAIGAEMQTVMAQLQTGAQNISTQHKWDKDFDKDAQSYKEITSREQLVLASISSLYAHELVLKGERYASANRRRRKQTLASIIGDMESGVTHKDYKTTVDTGRFSLL